MLRDAKDIQKGFCRCVSSKRLEEAWVCCRMCLCELKNVRLCTQEHRPVSDTKNVFQVLWNTELKVVVRAVKLGTYSTEDSAWPRIDCRTGFVGWQCLIITRRFKRAGGRLRKITKF